MTRFVLIVLAVALVGVGCSDDSDEPEGFAAFCTQLGQVDRELDPFEIVTTGGPEEVEDNFARVATVYDELLAVIPDAEPYPPAVTASTTTIPPTTTTEDGEGSDDDPEAAVPTPHDDLTRINAVLGEVQEVLATHDYDVSAAESDLRAIEGFAEGAQLAELVAAADRVRRLVATECPPPTTTTTTESGAEA